jgi:hypothetical protein
MTVTRRALELAQFEADALVPCELADALRVHEFRIGDACACGTRRWIGNVRYNS